jgi:Domain of unknown function (DUF892)
MAPTDHKYSSGQCPRWVGQKADIRRQSIIRIKSAHKWPEPSSRASNLFRADMDVYFAENKILKTLPKMAKAAQSKDLKAAFVKHEKETRHCSGLRSWRARAEGEGKVSNGVGDAKRALTSSFAMEKRRNGTIEHNASLG